MKIRKAWATPQPRTAPSASLNLLGIAIALTGLFAGVGSASALEPAEVAIICNSRVAASPQLARFYAEARGIPADHIIELALPDAESMPFQQFDWDVVMPVRQALLERKLRPQIKCLVTMYGVPIKLSPRQNTEQETDELVQLKQRESATFKEIVAAVTQLETRVREYDPKYKPVVGEGISELATRAETATARGSQLLGQIEEPGRQQLFETMLDTERQLSGMAGLVRHTKPANADSPEGQQWQEFQTRTQGAIALANTLIQQRHMAQSRDTLRELTREHMGLLALDQLLKAQIDYLEPDAITALDSDLAMLWVDNYPRKGYTGNPLNLRNRSRQAASTLMVSRLDGPQSGTAREMVLAGKSVENAGKLEGTFAIDSRGLPLQAEAKDQAINAYDQRLRELGDLIRRHTKFSLLSDDTPQVFKPNSAQGVALYCGWYSVRNYVPSFSFVPGAVGFHIASFEAMSLRTESEKGWVRGLLNDGIAATIGSVDEPYLQSFPDPVDYFGLLLTGKYTLAEVYWMTAPVVSWRMMLIGDPLYNPFAKSPALKLEQLPEDLRKYFSVPAAIPNP